MTTGDRTVAAARPKVTVVIIVQDDADLIDTAVESAVAQTYGPVEVLVVDHGSTDGTSTVVDQLATRHGNVRAIHLKTREGGPGRPLNTGIDEATGSYVTFMGSDDILPTDSVRAMVAAAQVHGADVVLGRTDRVHVDEGGRRQSWFHSISAKPGVYGDLGDRPGIMWDTISAAKLYRRALLEKHGIRFPEGVIYEDQIFTTRVYTHAGCIAVIPDLVYEWMVRRKGRAPSLTNTRADVKNLQDRIQVNKEIDEFFITMGRDDLAAEKHHKFVNHDLKLYINDLPRRSSEYLDAVAPLIAAYVPAIPDDIVADLPVQLQVQLYLLGHGDLETAVEVNRLRTGRGVLPSTAVRVDGHVLARALRPGEHVRDLSLFPDVGPTSELPCAAPVTSVEARGSDIVVTGTVTPLWYDEVDLTLVLGHRQFDRERRVPVSVEEISDGQFRWSAIVHSGDWPWLPRRTQSFSLRLESTDGFEAVPVLPVHGIEIDDAKVRPPGWPLTGTHLAPYGTTVRNRLAFRLEQRSRLVKWLSGVLSPKPLHWVFGRLAKVRTRILDLAARAAFRLGRRLALRDQVVFESFEGRSYSDSPRAISEALASHAPDIPQIWAFRGATRPPRLPKGMSTVQRLGPKHALELGRSRWWVDNFGLPAWLEPRPETTYLQTWHGVPYKRMFFDAKAVRNADDDRRRRLSRMVDNWSVLIASSPFFEHSFGLSANYTGAVLATGMPRNDRLIRERDEPRGRLRPGLGIPDDGRIVVLYAPTYRPRGLRQPTLDLEALAERFGDRVFIVLRQHYFKRPMSVPVDLRWFATDLSAHPGLNDLILASDALLTDYSSIMFDYALTGRPIVSYAPDEWSYSQHVGSYFDLEDWVPSGEVARTPDELEDVLEDLVDGRPYENGRYERFVERFAAREDGNASVAVVEEIFGVAVGARHGAAAPAARVAT